MYKLYWSPGAANMTPHAVLEDVGAPFELVKIDLDRGQQRDPNYLKLNPHARVPTLVYDGGMVMYESAAISLFLAERSGGAPCAVTGRSGSRPVPAVDGAPHQHGAGSADALLAPGLLHRGYATPT